MHTRELQRLARILQRDRPKPDVEAMSRRVAAFVAEEGRIGTTDAFSRAPRRRRGPAPHEWRRIALAVTVGALVVLGVVRRGTDHGASGARIYHTASGQRSIVRLADGSTIMLAPATTVTAAAEAVTVDGEAYFHVAQNAHHAFIVHTRNAVVQVLGTRFSVRQYPDEPHSRVVVEDGRVGLRSSTRRTIRGAPAVLTARTLAQISDSGVVVTPGIAIRDYTGWTHGTLVFNRVPLRDVVSELARVYGVGIVVDDSALAKRPLVLDIAVQDQPLVRVLDLIAVAMNAHYTPVDHGYVLSAGRGHSSVPQHQRFPQPEKTYGR